MNVSHKKYMKKSHYGYQGHFFGLLFLICGPKIVWSGLNRFEGLKWDRWYEGPARLYILVYIIWYIFYVYFWNIDNGGLDENHLYIISELVTNVVMF